MLFLRDRLAKRLGFQVPIDVVTGTSVGAINGTFMAATMDDPAAQGQRLVDSWRALRLEQLISMTPRDLVRAGRLLLGREPEPPGPGTYRYGGLLNTGGLERFVIKSIPWRCITRNLRQGVLHSVAVSATHVGTGHTLVFIQSRDEVPAGWSRDPFVTHRPARIGPRHVLASAAIPLLFPAVKLRDEFFTDGGLRQNTPMSPAIRLGADRILLVSLRHVSKPGELSPAMVRQREQVYPKPLFLAGKALNALLLDHTDYDLDRMARINAILEAGTSAFGDSFTEVINEKLVELRGAPIRPIEAMHIRPSIDIGRLAADFVANGRALVKSRLARRLIEKLAAGESRHESDLLSYLLFDGNFAAELIELGYEDARAKEDELAAFFSEVRVVRPTTKASVWDAS